MSNNVTEFFQEVAGCASFEMQVRKYSGRGMYGRECIGIVTDNVGKLFAAVLEYSKDEDEVLRNKISYWFERMRSDNMGMSMVYYNPYVEFEGEEEYHYEDED